MSIEKWECIKHYSYNFSKVYSAPFNIKIGQKFPTNRFIGNFIQPTYKIDMCPFTCEKHVVLIACISHMFFLIALIKKHMLLTYLKDLCQSYMWVV